MSEFETIPELTRVLTATNTALAALSRTQLQICDRQHLAAEIPVVYMGRYVAIIGACLLTPRQFTPFFGRRILLTLNFV